MSTTYELTRQNISRGTFKSVYAVRFRESGGEPIYSGESRSGYLAAEVQFEAGDSCSGLTFGPNRSFAPSAHRLKGSAGELIAEIRHGLVQSMFDSREFEVFDANGAPLVKLVPGAALKNNSHRSVGVRFSGALYAVCGEDILGHTGDENGGAAASGPMSTAAKNMRKIVTELPGVLADRFQEEVMGKRIESAEEVVARFTLLRDAALEPPLILAILMFKLHYHDMRGV